MIECVSGFVFDRLERLLTPGASGFSSVDFFVLAGRLRSQIRIEVWIRDIV